MRDEDVNVKGVALFLGIVAATLVVVYGVVTAMWRGLERKALQSDAQAVKSAYLTSASARPYIPFPREQPDPKLDLKAQRAREDVELNSYGWVDRTSGIVRIPIDRAIELLTQNPERRP